MEDKNDDGKELSNVTSEQISTGGTHVMKAIEKLKTLNFNKKTQVASK